MQQIIQLIRRPAAKILTRLTLYGLTAWWGMEAASAEMPAEMIGSGLGAVVAAIAAVLVDRWHHRADTHRADT